MSDGVNLPQHLICESGEHPPYPPFILLLQGQEFFTAEGEGQTPVLLLLHPHLHILRTNLIRPGAQRKLSRGLTAHQNIPVFQHRFRSLFPEADQRKQSAPASLGAENQLIFFSVKAYLKGRRREGCLQRSAAFFHNFLTAFPQIIRIHNSPQFRFHPGEGRPRFLCSLPKVLLKTGQSQTAAAIVYVFQGVLITGTGLQRLFKITQSRTFFAQIIISRCNTIIPAMIAGEILLMLFQKLQGFFIRFAFSCLGNENIGSGQFTIHLRGAFPGRDALQSFTDLLIFTILTPFPALFQ